jgi:putative peptidoglycan lipid II flippase
MVRKILNIFYKEFTTISEAALLLGFFTFLSQILGLVRDRLFAGQIGAGLQLDIYYAAFRIPDIVFAVAASLVSVTILIPFFVESQKKDGEDASSSHRFINSVFTVFFVAIIVIAGIIFVLMPHLAPYIAPGFDAASLDQLITLSRIMLLSPILLGFSNLLGTITQAFKKFFVYAIAPVFYNAGIIIGIVALYPIFGPAGLAYGVGLGALAHLMIQVPVVIRQGYLPKFTTKINWKAIGRIVGLSLPRTFTLSVSKIVFAILVAFASTLTAGSVSLFNFAWNIQNVPLALIGMSFSVAAFPTLVKFFSENDTENFLKQLVIPARQIVFWSIPVIIFFIVLRAQIVRVILGAGEFTWADTRLTAAALALFALSVLFQSLTLLLVRGYYAAGKTWRPLWVTTLGGLVSIGMAKALLVLFENNTSFHQLVESILRVQDVPGTSMLMLALAYTLGQTIIFITLWLFFRFEFMRTYKTGIGRVALQTLTGSLVMGIATYHLLRFFNAVFDINTFWGVLGQGFFAGFVGVILFVVVLHLLGNHEIRVVTRLLKKGTFWTKQLLGMNTQDIQ